VAVDLERIDAVLEDVLDRLRVPRQLARLAHRNEAGADRARHRAAEDEATRLSGRNHVHLALARETGDLVDRIGQRLRVKEQRGDVAEDDVGLLDVRYVAY